MHRYRKGQFFRPPTAAESAATADAVEAHRRRPPQPQDHSPVGQHILVKTPEEEEIPARDGDMIYFAMCKRCIQRNAPNGKEIVATDEKLIVFNFFEQPIPCDQYVQTALTECGVRYVLPAQSPRFAWATTTTVVATTTASFAVDNIVPCDGSTWTGDDPLTIQNGTLKYAIDDEITGLIHYMAKPDGSGDYDWYPSDFPCPSDCECESGDS